MARNRPKAYLLDWTMSIGGPESSLADVYFFNGRVEVETVGFRPVVFGVKQEGWHDDEKKFCNCTGDDVGRWHGDG